MIKKAFKCTLISISLMCVSVCATIINVPGDYLTIQAGINASSNYDTVLVQPNIYFENIDFNNRSIVLGSLFLTTGDTSYISSTIIDGASSGSVVTVSLNEDHPAAIVGLTLQNGSATNGGAIYFHTYGITLSNLIVRSNTASNQGGGIYIWPLFAAQNVYIDNCTISDNSSGAEGGGIYAQSGANCTLHITDCLIENNYGINRGGGVFSSIRTVAASTIFDGDSVMGAFPLGLGGGFWGESNVFTLDSCTFVGNFAVKGGGVGFRNIAIGATISNSCFEENGGGYEGGGIYFDDFTNQDNLNCMVTHCTLVNNNASLGAGISNRRGPDITIDHCLIAENSAYSFGGIFTGDCPNLVISNCTIVDNFATANYSGITLRGGNIVKNCIITGNASDSTCGGILFSGTASVTYCNIYDNPPDFFGSIPAGFGELVDVNANGDSCDLYYNISLDPMYVDTSTGDYHLQPNSPCIDAGDPSSPLDPDSTITDIGCYYFDQSVPGIPSPVTDLTISCGALDAYLVWSPVTTDTSGNPITVSRYVVYASDDPSATDSIGYTAPPDTNFTDTNALTEDKRFYNVKVIAGSR
jgi:hypothetical protein